MLKGYSYKKHISTFWFPGFTWNIEDDFKTVPECWIPATEIEHCNGKPFPDENGHIPGRKIV